MKTKNLAVGALAVVLTLALWWNFLLKPTRSEASKVKAETEVEKSKLQPLQAQLAEANADAAHASTFKAQLAALQHAVPDSPALAAWIRDANAIAAASNISWQSVTHGPPTVGADGIFSITLGIQVHGTYEQVMDYLTRMAALKRLVVVDSVVFSAAASTGAGAGSATSSGGSTGPFSGASQLTVTITARMFEIPALGADVSATGAPAAAGTGGTTGGTPANPPSSLQNS